MAENRVSALSKALDPEDSRPAESSEAGAMAVHSEHIISDEYVESLLKDNGQVTLAYSNFTSMPAKVPRLLGTRVLHLDLSYNNFKHLGFLDQFTKLDSLVLDRNYELDVHTFPFVPSLKLLWINNCDIINVGEWLRMLRVHCPALKHLSMMCNPGTRSELNGFSEEEEEQYREEIGRVVDTLISVDGCPIGENKVRNVIMVPPRNPEDNFLVRSLRSCSNRMRRWQRERMREEDR